MNNKDNEVTASKEMCAYCFDVLICFLDGVEPGAPNFPTESECPMFVTWKKMEHGQIQLRGCIGTLSPHPLSGLKDYTHSSAFRDRRFQPIAKHEVPSLTVSVSLLVHYEPTNGYTDWEIGVHGILIHFADSRNKQYSATYLPEVASEQGWTQFEAVNSLIRKAGYQGRINEALLDSLEVTRYQSSKYKLDYGDYCEYRGITA
eukprot:CAMPEP_0117745754 /NCGR_PEP_ID=MMETSP0947-20121206/7548_1 /TAXON_ID=44440 /ORGANISM="Chattonella subsalsa, Strain CCMP2191" /LENGTH=202 /DNA_ID=CAMNT_0005562965 /DNA_START=168 /DNA_END=776 /DNA_ORIENTATION=+